MRKMTDGDSLVGCCLDRLTEKYSVLTLLLGGSAAYHPNRALDADVCAVVAEDAMVRARITVAGLRVDLFVCGRERLGTDFKKGGFHQHLVTLFAGGKHIYGDRKTSDALQSLARAALRRPAPPPSKQSEFAHRSRPFNLLRKFRDIGTQDAATCGLIVAELVHSSIEAYFALNRIWTVGIRERMTVIAAHNPQGAQALRLVTEAPLATLVENPHLLEALVHLLVGPEDDRDEVWLG